MKTWRYLVVFWLLWPAACAHGWESNRRGAYEVSLVVNGVELPVYHHRGRAFVEGWRGQRYVVRIHNRSPRRIEAVVSVDGRDVIDGRAASLSKRGYVIQPWSSADIDGFRTSMDRVAAFRFSDVEDSYAARMGSNWTVGVVAVAVFPERVYRPRPRPLPRPPYYLDRSEEKSAAPRAGAAGEYYGRGSSRNLGTEFAEPRWSPVSETRFVRQDYTRPAARLAIRYDDRDGLCNLGLSFLCHPYPPVYPPSWPPAYPPEPPPGPFAEPPPGWEHFSRWY